MPRSRRSTATLLMGLSVAIAAWSLTSAAHDGASGIVGERMREMDEVRVATKTIAAMLRGKRELNMAEAATLADEVRLHGARIPMLFPDSPESRHGNKTEALPAVWDRRDAFEHLARELESAGASLVGAARNGDVRAAKTRLAEVVRTCKACHADFRKD